MKKERSKSVKNKLNFVRRIMQALQTKIAQVNREIKKADNDLESYYLWFTRNEIE